MTETMTVTETVKTNEEKWAEAREKTIKNLRESIAAWDWFIIGSHCKVRHDSYTKQDVANDYYLGTRNALMNRDLKGLSLDDRRRYEFCFDVALKEVAAERGLEVDQQENRFWVNRQLPGKAAA